MEAALNEVRNIALSFPGTLSAEIVDRAAEKNRGLAALEKMRRFKGVGRAFQQGDVFTQLVGLALGCSEEELGMQHNLFPLRYELSPMGDVDHDR